MRKAFYYLIILIGFISLHKSITAQNFIGKQYTAKEINAHPIMWDAISDEKERIYFANNDGVCRFDGQTFISFKTPRAVRSLVFGETNKIYIGSLGEFGVITFTPDGSYIYENLIQKFPQLPLKTGGSEQVIKVGNAVYFSCQNYMVQLNLLENTWVNHKNIFNNNAGVFSFEKKLYVNTSNYGLGVYEKGSIKIIAGGEMILGKNLAAKAIFKDKIVLVEPNGQCYELHKNKLTLGVNLGEKDIVALSSLPNKQWAVGTLNKGTFIFSEKGQKLAKIKSESDEIYTLYTDHEGSLWTAHNRGLQHTWIQAPMRQINTDNITGNISDILWHNAHLWVCSSAGLYQQETAGFNKINTQSLECWDIEKYRDKIYVATTDGLYILEGNKLTALLPSETILHLQTGHISGKLYALGENGIWQINSNGSMEKIPQTPSLCKAILEDENGLRYIVSYQDGLYDVKNKQSYFGLKGGKNWLRLYNQKAYLQHNQSLYELPLKKEEELPNEDISKLLGLNQNKAVYYEDGSEIWTNEGIKIMQQNIPNSATLGIIEGIPVGSLTQDKQIYVAYSDKIFSLNSHSISLPKPQINFNTLQTKGNVFSYLGWHFDKQGLPNITQDEIIEVSNESLPIRIQFSLQSLINPGKHSFSYAIDEQDTWSDWQKQAHIDWANVSGGNYKIRVKGKDAFGAISEEATFKFYIKVPWYLSGIAILGYMVLVVILVYIIIVLNQKQLITKNKKLEEKVKERTQELENEKNKSDDLLLNILPHEVAEELKSTGKYDAKQFDDISVLFTDFVGFTSISEKLSPKELVAEIHHCFKAFDEIIERCKLEKIKTIGDAYMAVCGMPNKDANHAIRVVEAALEIEKFIKQYQIERKEANRSYFEIRMGIHSGAVIAGIVGVKKYAYDIWGDTVNTAARMEQNSEPGKINISGQTYEHIKGKYKCSYRGKIEAKNKGRIDMYYVLGLA